MPVDRKLAYECLKWIDPQVYRAYLRLIYREITDDEFEKDKDSFYKVYLTERLLGFLDSAEQTGKLEIINDYENEHILVKDNQYNQGHDGDDYIA
jgi:hemerythrin superfamily protein